MRKAYIDSNGDLIGSFPRACVNACSASGDVYEAVELWRKCLGFTTPREKTIAYLSEFGAWTVEEMSEVDDAELARKVLWIACGDIKEQGEWFGIHH